MFFYDGEPEINLLQKGTLTPLRFFSHWRGSFSSIYINTQSRENRYIGASRMDHELVPTIRISLVSVFVLYSMANAPQGQF